MLQAAALSAVKNQLLDGLSAVVAKQGDIMTAIAKEKSELKPYLDEWEKLQPEIRSQYRQGKAGNILSALENVAQSIQAKHQEMFGSDEPSLAGSNGSSGENKIALDPAPDLSQTINIYRSFQ